MIYIYRELETRDGEREYEHKGVHELPNGTDVAEFLDDYCKDFWGEGKVIDGDYWFFGEIITKVYRYESISKAEYDVLKNYI
jgi:hypothetical protein